MSQTALEALTAALVAGTQPPPLPSDPLVLTSTLDAELAALTASIAASQNSQLQNNLSVLISSLPTSDAGLPVGALWNNGGIITRVQVAS